MPRSVVLEDVAQPAGIGRLRQDVVDLPRFVLPHQPIAQAFGRPCIGEAHDDGGFLAVDLGLAHREARRRFLKASPSIGGTSSCGRVFAK